jgi:hypothetical protein
MFYCPNKKIHLLGLLKNKHYEEINFPTLLYGQPQQFYEGFSYQQIIQWELLYKIGDFSTNILIFVSKVAKASIQKVIGLG